MIAVDILQVPVSTNNNRYLLVIQNYFTKWVDAIPLPASRIAAEFIKIFSTYGPPQILHSDQGRNFESALLPKSYMHLVLANHGLLHTIPKGLEHPNTSQQEFLHFCCCKAGIHPHAQWHHS